MGAAKFLRGLVQVVDPRRIRIIVNTGDDEQFYGLHVSPDLDTITYTLASVINRAHGWGRERETFHALEELGRFYGQAWFNLGDRDLATHLYRTERLRSGATLSEVTGEIARCFGIESLILPMSDDRVHTHVKLKGREPMPFQEYFVRRRASGRIEAIQLRGVEEAEPATGVIEAINSAEGIVLAPSNPFVSIAPIVEIAGVREALRAARDRIVAISPIVGGKPVKGPADKMMRGLGHEVSVLGVARLYQDFVGTLILDRVDRRFIDAIRDLDMTAIATDTVMSTPARAVRLAREVLRQFEPRAPI